MTKILIHLSEGFPILSLTLITEPLRLANRELGREAFEWQQISDLGGRLHSSSGIPLETQPLPNARADGRAEAAMLLTSYNPDRVATPSTIAWLRRMDRQGLLLGCVDTGALVFARAGLLEDRPAAAHPEAIVGYHRLFPKSFFIDRHVDFSPPRCSSAGGVATLDMTLALIRHFVGEPVAARVAEILTYEAPQADWQPRPIPPGVDPKVRQAVALMDAHLSQTLPVSDIAARLALPVWQLNRLFHRHLHHAPTSYYVTRRLARAHDMLRNTNLPIGDIASECGYDNSESFSRAYRTKYGKAPSKDRWFVGVR